MPRIALNAQALAAAMNAELYRRGVPAFVRVDAVVRAPAGAGGGWAFSLERSPVPLHDDAAAARYAQALFRYQAQVEAVAEWAAERFAVAWNQEAPRGAVFIPAPEPAGRAMPKAAHPVAAKNGTGGE